MKKERRKNLVPARCAILRLVFELVYGTIYCILYSVPIDLGTFLSKLNKNETKTKFHFCLIMFRS